VRALLEGEQILDVRKGGLREEGRHFSVQSDRVWLYPTVEHQEADLVKPAYRRGTDTTEADAPPDRAVRVEGWADIVGVATVTEPEVLDGGVEPHAPGLHREVPALLPEAALADVEDLLTLEQRPHDDRPFLERRNGERGRGHGRQDNGDRRRGAPWT